MDIHKMVTGFPRIRKAFALDRSFLVNHLLRKISIAGITALSTTPSMNLMIIRSDMLLIIPVNVASVPHAMSDQNTSLRALRFDA
jgi:hypothetical protein